jgi:hypothetical protein
MRRIVEAFENVPLWARLVVGILAAAAAIAGILAR